MIKMVRIATIAFSLFILAACAAVPVKESGKIEIKPTGIHEECASMHRGSGLSMRLKHLSVLILISITMRARRYFILLKKPGITSDSGKYAPETEDIYCLMWTNPNKMPVSLNYRYEIHDEVKPITPEPSTRPGSVY